MTLPRRRALVLPILLGLVLGIGGGTWAAFSSTTSNTGNSFSAAADLTAPSASSSVISRTNGYLSGKIKQGGTYYVYANVTDTGNPASGINTVKADVSNITTGATSITLNSGSFSTNGVSYNYRSGSQTANAVLTAGSKSYTLTMTDVAGNSNTQNGFSVTVDNTVPSGSDVQAANAGGGTVGKAETNDTLTYTFSEAIDPESMLTGWTGASIAVQPRFSNGGCGATDSFTVRDSTGTNTLPLGTVCLSGGGYVSGNRTFTGTMAESGTTITITLGTPSGAMGTETVAGAMIWTPSASALDAAGNACSVTPATESGALDLEF